MNILKHEQQSALRAVGLAAVLALPSSWATSVMAFESTDRQVATGIPEAEKSSGNPEIHCEAYDKCIALGEQLLHNNNPKRAIEVYQRAIRLATENGSDRELSEAYGQMGLAQEASGDRMAARAYIERARALAPIKTGWIEDEYKRLLIEQTSMSALDIQRKMAIDKDIVRTSAMMTVSLESEKTESHNSSKPPPQGSDKFTTNMKGDRDRGFDYKPEEPKGSVEKIAKIASLDRPSYSPHNSSRNWPVRRQVPPKFEYESQASLDLRINFEYKSAVLTEDGELQANELGKALEKILEENPGTDFRLLGHTDKIGGEEYNLSLSRQRADSVKAFLLKNFPALAGSLKTAGMGKSHPLFETMDEVSQGLNRRVEVQLQ